MKIFWSFYPSFQKDTFDRYKILGWQSFLPALEKYATSFWHPWLLMLSLLLSRFLGMGCLFVVSFFGHITELVGFQFPDQELNLGPQQWELGVLTTGQRGNSWDGMSSLRYAQPFWICRLGSFVKFGNFPGIISAPHSFSPPTVTQIFCYTLLNPWGSVHVFLLIFCMLFRLGSGLPNE